MKAKLFFLALLISVFSCTEDQTEILPEDSLKVEDFLEYGELHNAFLSNVQDNFRTIGNFDQLNQKIDYITDFQNDFVETLNLNDEEKDLLIENLERYEEFVDESFLVEFAFGEASFNRSSVFDEGNSSNIFTMIDDLSANDVINSDTESILDRLSIALKDNYSEATSDQELKTTIEDLVAEFNELNYETDTEGEMVGAVLAISLASIEWWSLNGAASEADLGSYKSTVDGVEVAPWLAADMLGAAVGATIAISGQALFADEINWKVVAYGTAASAVVGSTGAIGRIVKWLKL